MEWREEVQLVEVVMGDSEYVLEDCERVFSVGDLIEFWEGPLVRGYRTDSGDPAYVKEILGLGWYVSRSISYACILIAKLQYRT